MNDLVKLALGIWAVLFLTGVGMRAVDVLLRWWRGKK